MGTAWWIVIILWSTAAIICLDQTMEQMEPHRINKWWKKIVAIGIFAAIAPFSLIVNAAEIIVMQLFEDDGGDKYA